MQVNARSISVFLANLGGIGKCPIAPGTAATAAVGIPAVWVLSLLREPYASLLVSVVFFLGCYVSDVAERELGRTDPGEVVIDELVGYLVTMLGLPLTFWSAAAGFLAFRAFDIWKPWPVCALQDHLRGGLGIVMDDVGAGVYAHAVVWMLLYVTT